MVIYKAAILSLLCFGLTTTTVHAESLFEIYLKAKNEDPRILVADLNRRASKHGIDIANAARRPQINLIIDQDYEYDEILGSDNEEGRTEVGIDLELPIYNRTNNVAVDIARNDNEVADLAYDIEDQALLLRSVEVYFAVLRAADSVGIAETGLEALASQLELAEQLRAEQLIPISDVREARAALESATADLIFARNTLSAAREALRVVIGEYPRELRFVRSDVQLRSPEPADVESWLDIARRANPTLLQAFTRDQRTLLDIEQARARRYPRLNLATNYVHTFSDRAENNRLNQGEIALELTVPLYLGGSVTAQIAQTKLRNQLSNQQRIFTERRVEEQVRNAHSAIEAAVGRARALVVAVESNEASLEGIRAGVEVQIRTVVDLVQATSRLTESKVELSAARYDYLLSLMNLKASAGRITPADLEEIDGWLEVGPISSL